MKVKPQHALPAPVTGEIRFDDGYVIFVPQPELAKPHPADAYVYTLPGLPVHQDVMQYAAANSPSVAVEYQTDPLWARLCALFGGLLLVGVGLFFIILGLPS
jgi:hypothetical protein